MCRNTSFEPSSGWIKPNPFWALNHLTVPFDIAFLRKSATRAPRVGIPFNVGEHRMRKRRTKARATRTEKRRYPHVGIPAAHYEVGEDQNPEAFAIIPARLLPCSTMPLVSCRLPNQIGGSRQRALGCHWK